MAYEDEFVFPTVPKKWIGIGVLAIVLIVILVSLFYSVGPEEVGIIKRWGRYLRATEPGLHVKLPFVETVTKVKVKHIFKEEFGFRTIQPGIKTVYAPAGFEEESLMLTGDLNIAVVEWIVQYKIKDPVDYLFNVKDVGSTLRALSEVAMRQIMGDRSVDEVLTVGRIEAAQEAEKKLQSILDFYQTGIQIVIVKLKDVNPPDPVKSSFNEVNEAKQEKETTINQSWQAYNTVIPKAEGQAEGMITQAQGYAVKRVNQSKGDAEKFLAIWEEYKNSKDVTRRRLYLETMEEVLPKVGKKYVIDSEGGGILPLLHLGEEGGKQ